jgi:CHAD domain-containing protein
VLDLGELDNADGARAIAGKAARRLRRAVEGLPAVPSDDELHDVRIKAKRARYAAELVALGGDPGAKRVVDAFKHVQDVIGAHQDAVVAEERLRALAGGGTSLAAGRLVERERERKRAMREVYPDAVARALREARKAFS